MVVLRAIDAEHIGLLERPCDDIPGELRIARRQAIGERLPCIRVTKEVDAAREDDTRILGRLKACDEAELAASPETLATLLSGVNDSTSTRIVGGVSCETGRGGAEDRDEVGAVAERVWDTGEPDGRGAWGEDGRLGDFDGDDRCGLITFGVVGDERCPWGRGNEGEFGSKGGKRSLFGGERNEEVSIL